jgi:hypothetical protein
MEEIKEIFQRYLKEINPINLITFSLLIYLAFFKDVVIEDAMTTMVIDSNSKEDLLEIKRQVCRKSMQSILNQEPDHRFTCPDLIEEIRSLDIEIENSDNLSAKMRSDVVCTIAVRYKDDSLRVFDLDINDHPYGPLYYCVQDINEKAFVEGV